MRLVTQAIAAGQASRDHDVGVRFFAQRQSAHPGPLLLRDRAEQNARIDSASELQDGARMRLQVARLPASENGRHLLDGVIETWHRTVLCQRGSVLA